MCCILICASVCRVWIYVSVTTICFEFKKNYVLVVAVAVVTADTCDAVLTVLAKQSARIALYYRVKCSQISWHTRRPAWQPNFAACFQLENDTGTDF